MSDSTAIEQNPTLEMLLDINRCCLRLGVAWLPIVFDGTSIRLGPTIMPYRTPCLGCLVEHETTERRSISPDFPDHPSFQTLRETWPLPTGGRACLQCIRVAADCVSEVAVDLTDPHLGIPTVRIVTVGLQRTGEPLCSVLPRTFDLPVQLGKRDRRLTYPELFNGAYPH